MKRAPSNDPDDGFSVEITSLDAPETPEHAPDVLQGSRLAPRVRSWLTILSVVGGIFLVVVVFSPLLSSLLPKKTNALPKSHLPLAQIQNVRVQNGVAYINSSDGTLRALRVKNGALLWQRNSVSVAPLLLNNIIYIEYYDKKNTIIQALRARDALVLWTFKTSIDSNPLIIENGIAYPLIQYSSSQGRTLIALDDKNGAKLWKYTMSVAQSQNINIEGIQDKIYITTFSNAQIQNTDLYVLSIHTGLLLWHTKASNVQIIQNNLIYIITDDGTLKALRADDGHEVWHYKSTNVSNWSPFPGTTLFYIQTPEGLLQALRIDTGALQWRYKDPWGVAEVFPEANGVLYLETGDGFIVALRTSDGARLWHVRPVAPPYTFGSVQVINGIVLTFTTIGDAQYETIAALNANTGSLLWRSKINTYSTNNYMLSQISNDLFLADSGNVITALRAHDGVALWHVNYTQSTSQHYDPSLLTLVDNIVIIHSSDGVLEAHQSGTGALLWRYPRRNSS